MAATYISQVRNLALAICSIDAVFLIFVLFMMLKTKIMELKSHKNSDMEMATAVTGPMIVYPENEYKQA